MERLCSPVVATGGNLRQVAQAQKWQEQTKTVPSVAPDCLRRSVVRRGSPARVRKRALQKRRTSTLSRSAPLARLAACGGYEAVYGAFRSRTPLWFPTKTT